jgi:cytochrome c5
MTAGAGVLMPRYSIQATQDPEAVYNRVCIVCHAGQLIGQG